MQWLYRDLKTDPKNGISSNSIEARKEAYGTNDIPRPPPDGFWKLFLDALKDLTLIILIIAAVASIIINMIVEVDHRPIGKPPLIQLGLKVSPSCLPSLSHLWCRL